MGRPKKSAPAHVEPEFESQEIPEEEPEVEEDDEPAAHGKSISKAEAVRQALAAGNDLPEAGIGYLHSNYGIVMTRQMFSSYKAQEKARQAKKAEAAAPAKPEAAKHGPKPKATAVEITVTPLPKPRSAGEPDMLLALETVKELVGQFGADKLKRMVDIIG